MSDNPFKEFLSDPSAIERLSYEERCALGDKFKDYVKKMADTALPFVKAVIGLKVIDEVKVIFSKKWSAAGGFNCGENVVVLNCAQLHGPTEMLDVLAHECIHAHQYERGDLRGGPGDTIWCGQSFTDDGLPEHKKPWEVEAYSKMFEVARAAEALMEAYADKNL